MEKQKLKWMKSYCSKNATCAEGYFYKLYSISIFYDFFNVIRFSVDFIWCSKEFRILGPNALKLLVLNLTLLVFLIPSSVYTYL